MFDADKAKRLMAAWSNGVHTSSSTTGLFDDAREMAESLAAATAEIERLTGCLRRANSNHEEFERKWYLAQDECERLRKLVASIESPVRYTLATLPIPGAPDVVTTEHRDWTAIHRGRATSAYRQLTSIIGPIAAAIRRDAGLEGE